MRLIVHALAIVAVLTIVAAVAPVPPESDRAFYQQNHGRVVIPDCSGADCFRPLVATVLERLPGPSILKWKIYAVLANAIGALAVARFCVLVGLSATPSLAAAWLSALGAGALYAVYDCYTSDSLMYMVGPLMAVWLWQGRYVRAGALGGLGVFAKEFAAAPIWIFAIFAALERRWNAAVRLSLVSAAVTLVWLTMHASFIVLHNYSYGATTSADLLHGGYLATWLGSMRPTGAFTYLFTTFGALYLLWPVGLVRGSPALRRLAIAAVPAIAAFVYVQQPERALWNFHFIVIALAAVVLQDVPGWIVALLVGSYGVANMRIGAQLPFRGAGRAALAISVIIAAALAIRALRRRTMVRASTRPVEMNTPLSPIPSWTVAAAEASVFLVLVAALLDISVHRRADANLGVNAWGYRGSLATAPRRGVRIAMLGGSAAFAARTPVAGTVAGQLGSEINARLRWTAPGGPTATVVNLAEPGAGAGSYLMTLHDYAAMQPDIVLVYDGYDLVSAPGALGRHGSIVFRWTGYLPRSPFALLRGAPASVLDSAPDRLIADESERSDVSCAGASAAYCAAMADTVREALRLGQTVVVATPPFISARHEAQQRSLGDTLARAFGANARFTYVNLGRAIDLHVRADSEDGVYPSAAGSRRIVAPLAEAMLDLIPRLQ